MRNPPLETRLDHIHKNVGILNIYSYWNKYAQMIANPCNQTVYIYRPSHKTIWLKPVFPNSANSNTNHYHVEQTWLRWKRKLHKQQFIEQQLQEQHIFPWSCFTLLNQTVIQNYTYKPHNQHLCSFLNLFTAASSGTPPTTYGGNNWPTVRVMILNKRFNLNYISP